MSLSVEFSFDIMYMQIVRISTGNPLGPSTAKTFAVIYEQNLFAALNKPKYSNILTKFFFVFFMSWFYTKH